MVVQATPIIGRLLRLWIYTCSFVPLMVHLLRIHLDIAILWVVSFITRPDIAHAVHILSQFVSAPTSVHFGHLLRVLRYLRGTSSQCLFYACDSPLRLHAYSDSTWANDPTDRCSITGYCILLGSSHLAWKSKKQAAVSRSSTEVELRALVTTTSEIVWLRWLLADFVFHVMPPHLFSVIIQ